MSTIAHGGSSGSAGPAALDRLITAGKAKTVVATVLARQGSTTLLEIAGLKVKTDDPVDLKPGARLTVAWSEPRATASAAKGGAVTTAKVLGENGVRLEAPRSLTLEIETQNVDRAEPAKTKPPMTLHLSPLHSDVARNNSSIQVKARLIQLNVSEPEAEGSIGADKNQGTRSDVKPSPIPTGERGALETQQTERNATRASALTAGANTAISLVPKRPAAPAQTAERPAAGTDLRSTAGNNPGETLPAAKKPTKAPSQSLVASTSNQAGPNASPSGPSSPSKPVTGGGQIPRAELSTVGGAKAVEPSPDIAPTKIAAKARETPQAEGPRRTPDLSAHGNQKPRPAAPMTTATAYADHGLRPSPAGAAPAAIPPNQTVQAVIIGSDPIGRLLLNIGGDTWRLEAPRLNLPPGSVLDVRSSPSTAVQEGVAGTGSWRADRTGPSTNMPLPDLGDDFAKRAWDLLLSMSSSSPENDPGLETARPGAGDGHQPAAAETAPSAWRQIVLPVLGGLLGDAIRISWQEQGDQESHGSGDRDKKPSKRALFDVTFEALGRVQIEVVGNEEAARVMVRTERALPQPLRDDLRHVLEEARRVAGWQADLAFHVDRPVEIPFVRFTEPVLA